MGGDVAAVRCGGEFLMKITGIRNQGSVLGVPSGRIFSRSRAGEILRLRLGMTRAVETLSGATATKTAGVEPPPYGVWR